MQCVNMKIEKQLRYLLILLLLLSAVSCENQTVTSDLCQNWKFDGFGSSANAPFESAIPADSVNCFRIKFITDKTFSGFTATNSFLGEYGINGFKLKIYNFAQSKVYELGNGEKYSQALRVVERYELTDNSLKLFYNQSQNYLLFHLLK